MKKLLVLGLIFALSLTTGCGCDKKETKKEESKKEEQTEIKVNENEGVVEDKEVEGLKLTNTSLTWNGEQSELVTEVSNNTGSDKELKSFNIKVTDKDGKEMVTLLGYVGEVIPNGEVRTITSYATMNLSDAVNIEYTINK